MRTEIRRPVLLAILALLLAACGGLRPPAAPAPPEATVWVPLEVAAPTGGIQRIWARPYPPYGYLVEGDMLLVPEEGPNALGAAGNPDLSWMQLWRGGELVYAFDDGLDTAHKNLFLQAAAHVAARTPIRFRERTPEDEGYLLIISDGDPAACWSSMGYMEERGRLDLYCGDSGVPNLNVAVHEVLHAVGLGHEQSRSDRDEYVEIRWENILPGYEHNFDKLGVRLYPLGPYDYASLMHYSAYAFSKNGRPTIVPLHAPTDFIGNQQEMSPGDAEAVAALYGRPWLVAHLPNWGVYVSSDPLRFGLTVKNTGAVTLELQGATARGWLEDVAAERTRLEPGEEIALEVTGRPCPAPGLYMGAVTLTYTAPGSAATFSHTAGSWQACFAPGETTLVRLERLDGNAFALTYSEAGGAKEYALAATVNDRPATVEPARISEDYAMLLASARLTVPAAGEGDRVCITLTPLDSSLSDPAPGQACTP